MSRKLCVLSVSFVMGTGGCSASKVTIREPAYRMIIVRDNKLILDDTTSRQLDAKLDVSNRLDLRNTIMIRERNKSIPYYDPESIDLVLEVLISAKVEGVLVLLESVEADETNNNSN